MFVVSFASRALSRDPSGDRVIPRAEVRVRAQAPHGNITVLSHLKSMMFFYRAPDRVTVWLIQIVMQVGISSFSTLHQIAPPCLKQAWETESASPGASFGQTV